MILSFVFLTSFALGVLGTNDFAYERKGCPDCVSDFIVDEEIPAICTDATNEEKWIDYVRCVDAGNAQLSKALKHCKEDADHFHTRNDMYFKDACAKPPTQEQFRYHCCYQHHVLEFSQITWKESMKIQKDCATKIKDGGK